MRSISQLALVYFLLCGLAIASEETRSRGDASPEDTLPEGDGFVELIPAHQVERYRKLLPRVADEQLDGLLKDRRTIWYDEHSMPPAYQDSIPPFVGILETKQSGGVAPPEFFAGGKFRFPFGTTGGAHRAKNLRTVNFLCLPREGDQHFPIVWWRSGNEYRWLFPRGTVLGEVLFQVTPDQQLLPFEIRVRERLEDGWHADAFRPFPTAERLASAIRRARPLWWQSTELTTLVDHLEDPSTIEHLKLADPHGAFQADGGSDLLPKMDASLVVELLTTTRFESCEGAIWKAHRGVECYAPTAKSFSIVPAKYDAGLIAVNAISCRRCHEHAGEPIGDFVPHQVLYGQIWGSDETFSWHPFEPAKLLASPNGLDQEPLRRKFVGRRVIEKFNSAIHFRGRYRRSR